MMRGWQEITATRGGCQCGAVRYSVSAGPAKSVICHCRMCQRATGNAFAPLMELPAGRITWTGTPKEWASSDIASRGFCGTCGTPLYYRSGDAFELMAGTLAPDFVFIPFENIAVESRRDWLSRLPHLHDVPTPAGWSVTSRQSQE